jgi:transposase-like protein
MRSVALSFKLSYRDLVALMRERGIHLAHTTILRWVSTMLWSSRNDGSGSSGR